MPSPSTGTGAGALSLGLALLVGSLGQPEMADAQAPPEGTTVVRFQGFAPQDLRSAAPGWVGMRVQFDFTQGPEGFSDERVRVTGVVPGSPAERAGVRAGDELIRIGGTNAGLALREGALARLRPGDDLTLSLRTGGSDRVVRLRAAQPPADASGLAERRIEVVRLQEEATRLRMDSVRVVVSAQLDSIRTELLRFRGGDGTPPTVVIRRDAASTERQRVSPIEGVVRSLRSLPAGTSVPVPFGQTRAAMAPPPPQGVMVYTVGQRAVLGAEVVPVNPGLGSYFGVDAGLLVADVVEGTPGYVGGLRPGDVIVRAGGREVTTVSGLREQVDATRRGGSLELVVVRERSRTTLRIPGA